MKRTLSQSDTKRATADRSHRTLREIQKDITPRTPAPRIPLSHLRAPSTLPSISDRELEEAKQQLRKFRP